MYKRVEKCPWCKAQGVAKTFFSEKEYSVLKCERCGLVYSDMVLSEYGLEQFWDKYESKVHSADMQLTNQRKKMYRMDYDFIKPYLREESEVLDVGCGDGSFLDIFKENGCICEGTEIGIDAYELAQKKHLIYIGELSDISFKKKYDVIIFRGTIQYLLKPKESLSKAVELLNKGGVIFIGMINSDSICFNLYKNMFRLPVTPTDYYMFNKRIINSFMETKGVQLVSESMPYIGTPYENWEQDIIDVADAIRRNSQGKRINKKSPPFFDNIINLLYRKS